MLKVLSIILHIMYLKQVSEYFPTKLNKLLEKEYLLLMYIAKRISFLLLSLLNLNSLADISDVIQSCYFLFLFMYRKS